jgi:hypothetical protein
MLMNKIIKLSDYLFKIFLELNISHKFLAGDRIRNS